MSMERLQDAVLAPVRCVLRVHRAGALVDVYLGIRQVYR